MNIFVWILQIVLALYNIAGGIYLMGHYQLLATAQALYTLPAPAWVGLGILQVLLAIGLVVPKLASKSAIGLIVISLFGAALYVSYEGSGILWAAIPAIVLGFIAYSRIHVHR